MATAELSALQGISEQDYKRRIWAWTMYDWANSAYVTTVTAAVLPVYFSSVAGANLPSSAKATQYWSAGLFISLVVLALISPILGTISDVVRGKKRFMAVFAGIGILSTALLVLVSTGDWILASILAFFGRIGFSGSLNFYDALLPHVAREEDRDKVSARGFAMGYLGGGLLLAVNILMIQFLPGTWGARLSFLSVALWWAIFSIPIFRRVPEPPAAPAELKPGQNVITLGFMRLGETFADIRKYRELFKFLIAFLIYNDGIGTIIGIAAIYGAELGFGTVELVLAILLVQFVGIPFSLIFGRLPSAGEKRRPVYLAFILFNLIALPLVGVLSARALPAGVTGAPLPPYSSTPTAAGQGIHLSQADTLHYNGDWQAVTIPASDLDAEQDAIYMSSAGQEARMDFPFNGQKVRLVYSKGPQQGVWAIFLDGEPMLDADSGEEITIDAYQSTQRYGESRTFQAKAPGEHILSLVSTGQRNQSSQGTAFAIASLEVLPPIRQSNLGLILLMVVSVELVGVLLSLLLGKALFAGLARKMTTKRSILLSLIIYAVIAVWGFFLNSVVEFWFLAWMVAVVQGGSQALSRSLYSTLSPASKSGEFFSLFGFMDKMAGLIGPALFIWAVAVFGSSRPAVLSIIVMFILGGLVLMLVNVDEGRRVAQMEDAEVLG